MKKALLVACLFAVSAFAGVPSAHAQSSPPKDSAAPAQTLVEGWNDIGGRLVTMAKDWPEDKYDYRPNDKVRTFADVLRHVAGSNYGLINSLTGKKLGNEDNDPPAATFKTKAQIVAFLEKSVTDGAAAIQKAGDAGALKHLDQWVGYTEHMGEHFGLLVAYYRNNGVVPPSSRPQQK